MHFTIYCNIRNDVTDFEINELIRDKQKRLSFKRDVFFTIIEKSWL